MKYGLIASMLLGCSSQSKSPPELQGSARAPIGAAVVAIVDARPTRKVPVQVDRQLPDASWDRAADIAVSRLLPYTDEPPPIARVELKPVVGSDGSRLEFLMHFQTFSETKAEYGLNVLVVGETIVEPKDGQGPATEFLHSKRFPEKRIDRGLLMELLEAYGVVTGGWIPTFYLNGWAALDYSRDISKPVVLEYDKTGATLSLYKASPDFRPGQPRLRDRFVIQFDASAKMTMSYAREQSDGAWKPIPPEH